MEAAVEFHPDRDEKAVREAAIRFLEIADIVFSYEEASPFPDPLVEMRDPYQVSLYLSLLRVYDEQGGERYMYTLDEIEKILEENFGPGWREHKGR